MNNAPPHQNQTLPELFLQDLANIDNGQKQNSALKTEQTRDWMIKDLKIETEQRLSKHSMLGSDQIMFSGGFKMKKEKNNNLAFLRRKILLRIKPGIIFLTRSIAHTILSEQICSTYYTLLHFSHKIKTLSIIFKILQ